VRIVAVLLVVALAAGIPAGAGATGVRIGVNGTDTPQGQLQQTTATRDNTFRDPRLNYPDPRTQYPDPRLQYPDPRQQYLDRRQDPKADRRPVQPALPVIIITQPVYVTAPQVCVVPGYWAYAWAPQSYVSNVWVPGYYNYDALWVEGHYEPRAYSGGYYQPYWVPERAC
jgi:hypothetical protein